MEFLCYSLMRVDGDEILEHHPIGINPTANKILGEIFGYHLGNEAKLDAFLQQIKIDKIWMPPDLGTIHFNKERAMLYYFESRAGSRPNFDDAWLSLTEEGSRSLKRYYELTKPYWSNCIIFNTSTQKWQLFRAKDGLVHKRTPLNPPLAVRRLMSA